jgi:hypothetical protein
MISQELQKLITKYSSPKYTTGTHRNYLTLKQEDIDKLPIDEQILYRELVQYVPSLKQGTIQAKDILIYMSQILSQTNNTSKKKQTEVNRVFTLNS